ncbi:MAG TPA: helix-turn-helix domain-containing protein [Polyangiales bacterium]
MCDENDLVREGSRGTRCASSAARIGAMMVVMDNSPNSRERLRQVAAPAVRPASIAVVVVDELVHLLAARLEQSMPARRTDGDGLLTAAQAAELLQVNPRSLAKLASRDGLPRIQLGDKVFRYSRGSLMEWAMEREQRRGAHASKHSQRVRKLQGAR